MSVQGWQLRPEHVSVQVVDLPDMRLENGRDFFLVPVLQAPENFSVLLNDAADSQPEENAAIDKNAAASKE